MNTPTPTPRTDAEHAQFPMGGFTLDFARQLERELTAVIEQRDRLAEALRKFVGDALFCSHADIATTVSPHHQVDDDEDALTMP